MMDTTVYRAVGGGGFSAVTLNFHYWLDSEATYDFFYVVSGSPGAWATLFSADGNSGVSIRDSSRGRYALYGAEHDSKRTPSHIGYEIQIIDSDTEKYPSGSIYLFVSANKVVQHMDDWNMLDIESRHDMIRVRVNGQVTAEHPGDPERSKSGPIGLQLHDHFSWVMFRNIRLREIRR